MWGGPPWTAADVHVGLSRRSTEPNQGVRRGRGRPPHGEMCTELLTHDTNRYFMNIFASEL